MSDKQSLREEHLAYRRHLSAHPARKRDLDAAITRHAARYLAALGAGNVAAYAPLPLEPGGDSFLPALARASRHVFLPVSRDDGTLRWSPHTGAPVAGAFGIAEPGGARFTSRVLHSMSAIIVPALAVDAAGMRLGKGAGYYDRALHGVVAPTVAVVYERELVDVVPHESHDIPVAAVITETGVRQL